MGPQLALIAKKNKVDEKITRREKIAYSHKIGSYKFFA